MIWVDPTSQPWRPYERQKGQGGRKPWEDRGRDWSQAAAAAGWERQEGGSAGPRGCWGCCGIRKVWTEKWGRWLRALLSRNCQPQSEQLWEGAFDNSQPLTWEQVPQSLPQVEIRVEDRMGRPAWLLVH